MRKAELENYLDRAAELCSARKARLTAQRRRVLALMVRAERPLSAYELLDLLRESVPNAAPPTVYRALEFLLEQGLIHKIESLHAFVACHHPEHPHAGQFLICSDCGEVNEVANRQLDDGLQAASKALGFVSEKPIVEVLGTCKSCMGKHK